MLKPDERRRLAIKRALALGMAEHAYLEHYSRSFRDDPPPGWHDRTGWKQMLASARWQWLWLKSDGEFLNLETGERRAPEYVARFYPWFSHGHRRQPKAKNGYLPYRRRRR